MVCDEWPLQQKQWPQNQITAVLPAQSLQCPRFRLSPNSSPNQFRHDQLLQGPHSLASCRDGVLRAETLASASIATDQDI